MFSILRRLRSFADQGIQDVVVYMFRVLPTSCLYHVHSQVLGGLLPTGTAPAPSSCSVLYELVPTHALTISYIEVTLAHLPASVFLSNSTM